MRCAGYLRRACEVLLEATQLHPHNGDILLDIACSGDLPRARSHLQYALQLHPKLKRSALAEPDLLPLWPELRAEQLN